MKRCYLLLLTVLFVGLAVPTTASATWLSNFTGNSRFASPTRSGFVNFAVYINDGVTGNWITDLGLAGVGVLASDSTTPGNSLGLERNVFFGQITRSDTGVLQSITTLDWPALDPWIRIGYVNNTVFFDNTDSTAVVGGNPATAAQSLGANATNGTTGKTTGVVAPSFVTNASALEPDGGTITNAFDLATFDFSVVGGAAIPAGGFSSIFFLTSHSQPLSDAQPQGGTFGTGSINGSLSFDVPVSNPEPGSLVLLSFAGIGGAGLAWRRRRKEKKQRDDGNGSVSIA